MNRNNLISIIVPVYNGEKYIKRCLNSILNNTYKNIELIIVNDGSKDSSSIICRKIEKSDNRVKYFEKENGGIVSARNYGINKAMGKYICFADQDDEIPPNAYEILYRNIKENNSQMCIGSYKILYENTKINCFEINEDTIYDSKKKIVDNLIVPTIENVNRKIDNINYKNIRWNIWNCIYSKKSIDKYKIKFIKFIDYEDDLLFNLEFYKNAECISLTRETVYYWRKNLKSTSNSKRYIENYWNKAMNLRMYYLNLLKEIEINKKLYDEIEKRINERIFLDYLYNECNSKEKNKLIVEKLTNIYNKIFYKYNIEKLKKIDLKYDVINTNDYIARKKLNKKKIKTAFYNTKYLHNIVLCKIIYIYRCIKLIRRRW